MPTPIDPVQAELRRIADETQQVTGAFQARLQNVEQHIAGADLRGGTSSLRGAGERVSAQVLKEIEGSLEDLRNGRVKSLRASIPTLYAAITSPDIPMQADRDAEIYGPLARPMSVRDLLVQRRTGASAIEYLRATRTGTAGIQAAEGDVKAEIDLGFTLMSAAVRTIAAWVPASRQVLDDSQMLADVIDTQLRDAVRAKEDEQLLNGDGVGSNILGLIPNATAYSAPFDPVGTETGLDVIRLAVTQLQLARGQATGLVINPVDLARLELLKDADGRYIMSFDVTDNNGRTTLWRVPTVVTDAIAADKFLLGDFGRAARLYDRQLATVEVATQHDNFFVRNLVAVLCEERVALTVNRPDLLLYGDFGNVA